MFTGIIEEMGEVTALDWRDGAAGLTVRGPGVLADARRGDSVAVNGCCLTITDHDTTCFSADVMSESLARTALADLRTGSAVNLERAVPVTGRLGGHVVQGHVDGVGTLVGRSPAAHWDVLRIAVPKGLARYLVPKGSITVDGVSLTVVEVTDRPAPSFTVALIPTTLAATTLGGSPVGGRLNIEVDVIAKYVERLLVADITEKDGA